MSTTLAAKGKKGNHKIDVKCANCGKYFMVSKYRIDRQGASAISCSYKCAGELNRSSIIDRFSIDQSLIQSIESEYKNTSKRIRIIALDHGVSRDTVMRYAKKSGWKRLKRPATLRELYRSVAQEKLGRPLVKYEQVHHIDLDTKNNDPSNLHVYTDAVDHSTGHKSLEKCAVHFLHLGLIVFNPETGLYNLKK